MRWYFKVIERRTFNDKWIADGHTRLSLEAPDAQSANVAFNERAKELQHGTRFRDDLYGSYDDLKTADTFPVHWAKKIPTTSTQVA